MLVIMRSSGQGLLLSTGVECTACAEKADLVARVREVIHYPEEPFDSPFRKIGLDAKDGGKSPDLDEILSRLKNLPGMKNIKVGSCPLHLSREHVC
jgi:hypothetical protein